MKKLSTWIKERLKERNTTDGVAMLAGGIVVILFAPLTTIVAYCAIGYGAYTIWKKEK